MAGATQLVVTGAFVRASLSLAAYQLRAARKRPESTSRRGSKKKLAERKRYPGSGMAHRRVGRRSLGIETLYASFI
ncbi:uncharacterized protein LOC113464906 [Ceratina calcarata]|uniref:Uncharacterized protein LOC113464906 n=1 Tax=Ceratina calcarata TaxID=156304 RepID=A0AAJ7WED8_9HYME|nr:uncharacterized protein LOC113464906 [Ceratina calcarata]